MVSALIGGQRSLALWPNNSFKPTPCRGITHVLLRYACTCPPLWHGSGFTQALADLPTQHNTNRFTRPMTGKKSEVATKNQHWVPQFYLRQFATEDSVGAKTPKVWVWDKSRQSSLETPVSVRNVCGQRYLYSPEAPSGSRDPTLENVLSELEGTAAKVWPYLITGEVDLTNQEIRHFLANFFSIMHLRNVFIYRTIDRTMELRDKLYGTPKPEFLASRRETDPDPTHSGRFFVHTMLQNIRKFASQLSQKPWMVLASDEPGFFTSDRPVVFTLKSLFRANSELLFPLTPRHVLATHGFGEQPRIYVAKCPSSLVSTTNHLVEAHALKFIISAKPRAAYEQI